MPQGFAGGPLVENPPANAGDMDSIPTQGAKIPHAEGQQRLCSTTTELEPTSHKYRAHTLQLLKPTHLRARAPQEQPP